MVKCSPWTGAAADRRTMPRCSPTYVPDLLSRRLRHRRRTGLTVLCAASIQGRLRSLPGARRGRLSKRPSKPSLCGPCRLASPTSTIAPPSATSGGASAWTRSSTTASTSPSRKSARKRVGATYCSRSPTSRRRRSWRRPSPSASIAPTQSSPRSSSSPLVSATRSASRWSSPASDAAEPALACLKAFVGARYGETASRAVVGDAGKEIALDPSKGAAEMSSGAVLRGIERRHRGCRRAPDAPPARQHGRARRPAPRRQRAGAPRLRRRRRHWPSAHRQGHLGPAQRRACRSSPPR